MQTFRALYKDFVEDPDFKDLYEKECHICSNTMGIFARLFEENITLEFVAEHLNLKIEDLRMLLFGDYCDPRMVIALCRYLDMHVPENCPRMKGREQ